MTDRVSSLLDVYAATTPETRADGGLWYARGRRFALYVARTYHVSLEQAAGVTAALSPRKPWRENKRLAILSCKAHAANMKPGDVALHTLANVRKAWAILDGVAPLDVLGGAKVRAFYRNLTGDLSAVTVDAWAMRAADGVDPKGTPTPDLYAAYAVAYTVAASVVGLAPAVFQAVVWIAVRGSAT
jgi:hypothetical protein